MTSATAMSFARMLVVAAILPVSEFGHYSVALGMSILLSKLLGAGLIDATYGEYPRLWVRGEHSKVLLHSDRLSTIIWARSTVLLTLVGVGLLLWGADTKHLTLVIFVSVLVIGSDAFFLVRMSTIRATSNTHQLGLVSVMRAASAAVFGISGAYVFGVLGALVGEALGVIVGSLFARRQFLRVANITSATAHPRSPRALAFASVHKAGAKMMVGQLLNAVPLYADRLVVAVLLGSNAAGTYGVVSIFVTGAAAVSGIFSQKVGPQLVYLHERQRGLGVQVVLATKWAAFSAMFSVIGLLGLLACVTVFGFGAGFVERYELTSAVVGTALLLSAVQVTALYEWVLIARRLEAVILATGTINIAAFAILVLVATHWVDSLWRFILGLVLLKFVHLTIMLGLPVLMESRRRAIGKL